jgi:hypothetical protein
VRAGGQQGYSSYLPVPTEVRFAPLVFTTPEQEKHMSSVLGRIIPTAVLLASVLSFLTIPKPVTGDPVPECEKNLNPPPPWKPWCCWCWPFDPEDPESGYMCVKKTEEGTWKDNCTHGLEGICPEENECVLGGGGG